MREKYIPIALMGLLSLACEPSDDSSKPATGGSAGASTGGSSGTGGGAGTGGSAGTAGSAGAPSDAGSDASDAGGLMLILLTPNAAPTGATIVATGQGWDTYLAQDPAQHYLDGFVYYKAGVKQNTGGPTPATQDATDKNKGAFVVPNLPAGAYDVAMSFRNGVTTNSLPFTIGSVSTDAGTDAGTDGGTLACFSGGTPQTSTGSGSCSAPFVIDLSTSAHGTIGSHATSSANAESDFVAGVCKTFPKGTTRDVVYHVKLPADTKGLEVSVDAAIGGNPIVAVLEDPSCGQPANACSDLNGPNACEVLFAPRSGSGFFGTSTFVVVSEVSTTGVSLTTRFRSVGP